MATVIDLFAGCGGAALGLQRSGWRHLACVEHDRAAAATLAAAGFPVLEADVRTVDWSAFTGRTDLLWASPPCQPGSTAGRRRGPEDPRDGWPWTFDALDAVKPTWFLAENVLGWTYHTESCRRLGLEDGCSGCAWEKSILPGLASRFSFHGVWQLDAADYGVPQRRRRILLWAGPLPLYVPPPTHGDPRSGATLQLGTRPWRTLRDAIGSSLLDPSTCDQRACYPCDGSFGRSCSEPWRADLPSPTVTTSEVKGTRAHGPRWTFNGGPDRASDAAFLIAGVRRIDIAEGLRLQDFPEDWPLQGTRAQQYRQIGNAVPPALAEAAGRSALVGQRALTELGARGLDPRYVAEALRRSATSS